MPATLSPCKGKPTESPPSQNMTTTHLSLQQLKSNIKNAPGVITNAADTCHYLALRQWSLPKQKITCSHMATILLSIVSTLGAQKTSDKLLEATANTIKADAFLLEETDDVQNTNQTTAQLLSATPNTETPTQIKESINNLRSTMQKQMETLQKC